MGMRMKIRHSIAALALGMILFFSAGPASPQQTFTQTDLEGSWVIYLYGAYETKTEHMFGTFYLNGSGGLTNGSNTYRGTLGDFLAGQLNMGADGGVTGFLQIETWAIRMDFLRARMDRSKTEVTGFVTGQWYPCLIRMIKAGGEPAGEPEPEEAS